MAEQDGWSEASFQVEIVVIAKNLQKMLRVLGWETQERVPLVKVVESVALEHVSRSLWRLRSGAVGVFAHFLTTNLTNAKAGVVQQRTKILLKYHGLQRQEEQVYPVEHAGPDSASQQLGRDYTRAEVPPLEKEACADFFAEVDET